MWTEKPLFPFRFIQNSKESHAHLTTPKPHQLPTNLTHTSSYTTTRRHTYLCTYRDSRACVSTYKHYTHVHPCIYLCIEMPFFEPPACVCMRIPLYLCLCGGVSTLHSDAIYPHAEICLARTSLVPSVQLRPHTTCVGYHPQRRFSSLSHVCPSFFRLQLFSSSRLSSRSLFFFLLFILRMKCFMRRLSRYSKQSPTCSFSTDFPHTEIRSFSSI